VQYASDTVFQYDYLLDNEDWAYQLIYTHESYHTMYQGDFMADDVASSIEAFSRGINDRYGHHPHYKGLSRHLKQLARDAQLEPVMGLYQDRPRRLRQLLWM
jgi:hypothetical protein